MESSRNFFSSHFLTTSAPSETDKAVDIKFFPKKGDNGAYGSTEIGVINALCKKHEGIIPSRYEKNMTKVTQAKLTRRLKGNMKSS